MKLKTTFLVLLALGVIAAGVNYSEIKAYAADCMTAVVTESDITRQPENTPPTNNWVLYTRNAGNAAFRSGPGTPPLGIGSLEFTTPTGADKATLFNYDYVGQKLSDVNAISYSTYRTFGSKPDQVAALNVEVDVNGAATGGFTTLVFEPVYNTAQGTVTDGVWQSWNAFGSGRWWSTRDIPGVCAFECYASWNDIVAANPDAVIAGGVGINQGSGNPGLTSAVDKFKFGTTTLCNTFNFEPYRVAESKDQCKNNGWQTYKRADGSSFKNQGDCVSYTNNGK